MFTLRKNIFQYLYCIEDILKEGILLCSVFAVYLFHFLDSDMQDAFKTSQLGWWRDCISHLEDDVCSPTEVAALKRQIGGEKGERTLHFNDC